MATAKKAAKKLPTKDVAVVKDEDKPVLRDLQYFTATYNKRKIRGIAELVGSFDNLYHLYNKTSGDVTECPDDNRGYAKFIEVYGDTVADLKEAGVTNYVPCTDKRQIAIIDTDKNPEILGHTAQKDGNTFKFGCGAVELTRNEIKTFLKVRQTITPKELAVYHDVLEQINEEVDVEDIKDEDIIKVLEM